MNLHEMDKLHTSMVRQMEEAGEMEEVEQEVRRKTSVSAACQTDKVLKTLHNIVGTIEPV